AKQEVRASKKYYNNGNSKLVLVWDLSVDMGTEWLNAFVDVASGEIVAVNNWGSDFSDATYSVTPRFQQAPVNGLQRIKSPWDLTASPQGWHVIKGQERNDLAGNNVAAASNPFGSQYQTDDQVAGLDRPSSQSLTFDYQLNDRADPMTPTNINAAVTNMFVAVNTAHDLFYNYGFTEPAANFQFDNLGKGGREGDGVLATSQDEFNTNPQSRNNANFLTPPDGQSGRMRMYIFDSTRPGKDGAFDNSIVYHEMAHGLSNRLTGGGSNPNCLPNNFSGGMGEGWSDVMAMVLTLPANANRETNTEMGSYVLGGNRGIRHYPYSTSIQRNPLKFSTLGSDFILATDRRTGQRFREVHNIGEVWTSMLYEVLWNMVDVSGWVAPAELMTSQSSGKGNADFITVVIGGMKLQPCNPNFLQAREAILDAERTLFQGKYKCAIWQGFAKRGMGVRAQTGGNFADSFDAPAECNGAPQSKPPTVPKTTAGSTAGSKTTAGPGPVSSPVKTMITIEVPRPASSRPAPQPTKSAPTTDRPATGSLEGQSCKSFGATQCVGGVTYLCAYYQSFGMTWSKWYSGGC
ncbi:Fungalysin metallopeptidase-domain-containing protein, partial [Chytriomyces sp. MP71]